MIHITDIESGINVFKALDSKIRIEILDLLLKHKSMNMNELSSKLKLSNAAVTMHIKIMEDCGIINVQSASGKHGTQKLCSIKEDKIIIDLLRNEQVRNFYQADIGIGHYSSYQVFPTCGLASKDKFIGEFDDPRYFAAPERINADILWFAKGYIEYRIPNYIKPDQTIEEIQISMEICSEAPGYCENWPSDIYFHFNDVKLGYWTCPGDFGDRRGLLNPVWWPDHSQYGKLKLLSINKEGTFLEGYKLSDINLEALNLSYTSDFILKLSVPEDAKNVGGLTLFGKSFGNYNQDIQVRIIFA